MGRRFPDGGLLRYRKWVPQQLGNVIVVTNSPPIGLMRSQLTNHQVGIVFAVRVWWNLCICSPGMVELVGTNLAPDFPLFHGYSPLLISWQWGSHWILYCNDFLWFPVVGRGHVRCEHQTLLPSPHTSLSCPENPDTCFIMNTTTTFSSLTLLLNNSYSNS